MGRGRRGRSGKLIKIHTFKSTRTSHEEPEVRYALGCVAKALERVTRFFRIDHSGTKPKKRENITSLYYRYSQVHGLAIFFVVF